MNITLFGSAFDPVHLGHQYMATQMLTQNYCEQVWFVPVHQHPFGKKVTNAGSRVEMLELIIEPNMRIETYELEKEGNSYSFDTLEFLSKKFPEHQFSWLIGSDNLQKFSKWKEYEQLLAKYTVFVYPRKGFDFTPWYAGMKRVEDVSEIDISSTQVREKLENKESIDGLVDDRIKAYIQAKNLYL